MRRKDEKEKNERLRLGSGITKFILSLASKMERVRVWERRLKVYPFESLNFNFNY